ncbi:MAG: radical SAM protein [Nitrospirota bacterium]
MRVLLIKPYNLSDHIQPSLGLGWLAASIQKTHHVSIIDCIKEDIKKADWLEPYIKQYKPDVVGIQCYTFHLGFIKEVFDTIRRVDKSIIKIIGGPHPSAVPEETMRHFLGDLDFVFAGESEIGLPRLLEKLDKGNGNDYSDVPGLVWCNKERIIINDRAVVDDLDSLGFPAWDLIHPETYPEAQHGAFFKRFPIAPIMITRGCPYLCTFCGAHLISGRRLRRRSADHVIKEIKMLYNDYGIREFHIVDDNFTINRDNAKEFLRKLIDLNIEISWATPNGVRMDTLDEEMLVLMKKSGLYLISLGIESGSDRVLKLMKKNITVERVRNCIKMIKNHGIDIAGFFIIGFPGETAEDIEKTVKFSLELDLIRANYFTYLPFPGTESYKQLESNGELDKVNWDRLYFMSAPYAPKGMDRKTLKKIQRMAFLRFYGRPAILIKNILQIKSLNHLRFLLRRFFHWVVMK